MYSILCIPWIIFEDLVEDFGLILVNLVRAPAPKQRIPWYTSGFK